MVLVLVGEGGAGPHDLAQMMRKGRVYWTAAESQWYAEPKRLAGLGYLKAEKRPGRTHDRTHYVLTAKGRRAVRDWVSTPAPLPRIQNEPVARALAVDLAEPDAIAEGLEALRAEIADGLATADQALADAGSLPDREAVLLVNHRFSRRMLELQLEWLDEVQRELRALSGRTRASRSARAGRGP